MARHFSLDKVRTIYVEQGDGEYIPTYYWPEVTTAMNIGGKNYSWTRAKRNSSARSTVFPRDISHLAETLVYDVQSKRKIDS